MFTAALGIPKQTPFQPTKIPKMDVSFRPLTQPGGSTQYVAIIETEEKLIIKDDDCQEEEEEEEEEEKEEDNTDTRELKDPFSLGGDPIKTFYVGSITILGLYLLYKILNRAK
jgi:hypothetical protein